MKDIKFSDFLNSLTDDDFAQLYSDGNSEVNRTIVPLGNAADEVVKLCVTKSGRFSLNLLQRYHEWLMQALSDQT